jgi:DNA-binding NarL/FixJ family response regulator
MDEQLLVVEALRSLLEKRYEVVGFSGDVSTVVERATQVRPDIVLIEVLSQHFNGFQTTRHLKDAVPHARVIFVTADESVAYVDAAFRAGAWGYVLKRSAPCELFDAIECVLSGRRYTTRLAASLRDEAAFATKLSHRQKQVLRLSCDGKTLKEMASILNLSHKTIEFHKSNLLRALGMPNTGKLIRYVSEQMRSPANGPTEAVASAGSNA